MQFLLRNLILGACCIMCAQSIPIDNGVEGEPEIECGAAGITVNFNTRNNFEGHVYVLGRYDEAGCRSDEGGRRVAGIKLTFDKCGTQRQRSLNPRGIYVSSTVVVTFHPQFLTKVDRAYRVQCFYMEADKTVSQELEVSDITTAFQTQLVPMPLCTYQILEGGPNGQPIKYAEIGQQVYHKWNCATETTDIFCAIIHSCFVDDGSGNRVQLLDQNGCALDRYLLQNLEYASDLMAGQEAHVFKYADKPALFFQCEISISIKEPDQQCSRPQCAAPGGAGAGGAAVQLGPAQSSGTSASVAQTKSNPAVTKSPTAAGNATRARQLDYPFRFRRFRRDVAGGEEIGVWDVISQTITALDVSAKSPLSTDNNAEDTVEYDVLQEPMNAFCMTKTFFVVVIGGTALSSATALAIALLLAARKCMRIRKF